MNDEQLRAVQVAIHELVEKEDFETALPLIYKVLEEYPNDAATLHFLGYIWLLTGKEAFAYQLFRRALQEMPSNKAVWTSFGRASHELERYDEALNAFLKSAELDPNYALAYSNASATLVQMSKWDDAEKSARMALDCDPRDLNAQMNLAHCYLAQGKWREGWSEWRKSLGTKFRKHITYNDEPQWNGSADKTLVVYGEQGLGDEIFYASCLNDAIDVSKKVYVDCDPKLEGLFRRSFPKAEVYGTRRDDALWADGINFDAGCPIGGLPEFFRNNDKDFNGKPFLIADPERVLMWKALFQSWGKKVIGITTHGGSKLTNAKGRKLTEFDLQPLLKQNYEFVSLDYNPEYRIDGVHYFPFAAQSSDYDDTAALIAACDKVIGVNTTALHCAAALGVDTIALIPDYHQWRYARPSMLWYRSMRTIDQKGRQWREVMEYLAKQL
jgi:Tfp pilus assembly protein PilF